MHERASDEEVGKEPPEMRIERPIERLDVRTLDYNNEGDREGIREILNDHFDGGVKNLEELSKILQVETHEPKIKGITMSVLRSHLGHWKRYKEKHEEETDLEDVDTEIDEDARESITRKVDERIAPMKEDLRELRTNFNALVERMKPEEEEKNRTQGTARR